MGKPRYSVDLLPLKVRPDRRARTTGMDAVSPLRLMQRWLMGLRMYPEGHPLKLGMPIYRGNENFFLGPPCSTSKYFPTQWYIMRSGEMLTLGVAVSALALAVWALMRTVDDDTVPVMTLTPSPTPGGTPTITETPAPTRTVVPTMSPTMSPTPVPVNLQQVVMAIKSQLDNTSLINLAEFANLDPEIKSLYKSVFVQRLWPGIITVVNKQWKLFPMHIKAKIMQEARQAADNAVARLHARANKGLATFINDVTEGVRATAAPIVTPRPNTRPNTRPSIRPTARVTPRPTARVTPRPITRPSFRPITRPSIRPITQPMACHTARQPYQIPSPMLAPF